LMETGGEVVVRPPKPVATAVSTWLPTALPIHEAVKGMLVSVEITEPST